MRTELEALEYFKQNAEAHMKALWIAVVPILALFMSYAPAHAKVCTYEVEIQNLYDLIPDIIGGCVTDEWQDESNGDTLQLSQHGLLHWRRGDDAIAFTDGYRTWLLGPNGLQQRLNTERFDWEHESPPLPVPTHSSNSEAPVPENPYPGCEPPYTPAQPPERDDAIARCEPTFPDDVDNVSVLDEPLVATARRALEAYLHRAVPRDAVTNIEPVDWPNAALGLDGGMSAQVIVPGYRITITYQTAYNIAQDFEVRTNSDGRVATVNPCYHTVCEPKDTELVVEQRAMVLDRR